MAEQEPETETHASKENEPVSDSGRTSVAAKLPKLEFFSSSKFTSETDVAQSQTNGTVESKTDKLPSKPPSRQRQSRGETPTVTAQRLDIRIDLPNVTSVVKSRRIYDGGRSLEKEEKEKPDKNKPVSDSPRSWKRSKDKEERARTKTWPSLQYKLWLDASNLPLHLLCSDERANRPQTQEMRLQEREKRRVNLPHVGSRGSSKAAPAGKNVQEWSAHCLSVSKPPTRPDTSSRGASRMRMRNDSQERKRDAILLVGAGETWQVTSSYANRRSRDGSLSGSSAAQGLACLTGGLTKPRLPSRIGHNNLDVFLKQTSFFDVPSRPSETNNAAAERSSTQASVNLPQVFSITRQFCNSSAEVSLLTLRSYARNPRILQEIAEKEREEATRKRDSYSPKKLEFGIGVDTSIKSPHTLVQTAAETVGGVKQVRFKVPCGRDEDGSGAKGLMAKTSILKKSNEKQLSDVTPPPTPPTFDQAYRIKCYITPRIRSGSSE